MTGFDRNTKASLMRHWTAAIALGLAMNATLPLMAAAQVPVPASKPGGLEAPDYAPSLETIAGIPVPVRKRDVPEGYVPERPKLVLRSSQAARDYFGYVDGPAPLKARAIGSYARGCLAGGKALPVDGRNWQVMRLSRNRNWGHPELIDYLEDLAADAPGLGWRGLLVGDLSQPRGGPMTFGHTSHQIGLDADIWLREMPDRQLTKQEREEWEFLSMLKGPLDVKGADRRVDPNKWTDTHARLIRRAAQDKRVARILVNPTIKKALCAFETGSDRSWLRKIRPWWGHHYHFHVRLSCPRGSVGCKNQDPPPPGDGCGSHLTYWLSDEPWVPKKPRDPNAPVVKKRPMALAALPQDCRTVLTSN